MHGILIFALVVTAIAAVLDWRTGEIPNWLSAGPLAVAPVAHFGIAAAQGGVRAGVTMAGFSVLGALVCAFVPFLFWRKGGVGGGDVKLLASVGAMLVVPVTAGIEAELYAFIVAMILAPARLAFEGKLLRTLGNTAALAMNPFLPKDKRRDVPAEAMSSFRFAPAVFVAVAIEVASRWTAAS